MTTAHQGIPTPASSAERPAPRAQIRMHAERSAPDEADAILAAGLVAHVGFVQDGQPFVIPMTYQYDPAEPGRLYLHGGHQSRLLEHLAAGAPVCVTVTLLDGLVYSKTALYHSVNYRSVVCFARAVALPSPERQRDMLHAMVARCYPGRRVGVDFAPIPDAHLGATALVALEIEERSAKVRRGGPKGPGDGDPNTPGTAGVIPLQATP
jgi:nitroimidazol reductase NimA-like FMN-containing flavoprotein (pyridoxamine 5'-phosphate oxidase superfamily)